MVVDETMIRVYYQRYWLLKAVDPASELATPTLFPTRAIGQPELFFARTPETHSVGVIVFLVDSAPDLNATLSGPRFHFEIASVVPGML